MAHQLLSGAGMKKLAPIPTLFLIFLAACPSGETPATDKLDGGSDTKLSQDTAPPPIDTRPSSDTAPPQIDTLPSLVDTLPPPTDTIPPSTDTTSPIEAALLSLTLSPASATVALGATQAFVATGAYEDGSKKDLSSKVTWSVTPATLATVSATGVVTGVAPGKVTVQAEMGGKTGSIELTITAVPLVLTAIQVSAAANSVDVGNTVKLTASGTFSDGSKNDISAKATWVSSDVAIATVSVAGVATAVAPGTVAIKATFEGKDSTVIIKVTTPAVVLSSLSVTAPFATLATGASLSLVATGTYSDGSKKDVSSTTTWTTSDATVAMVSGAGTVSGVAAGKVTIKAAFSGMEGTVKLTVTVAPLALVMLDVTIDDASVPKGAKVQMIATATYADNSKKDLSATVTWTSSAPNLATIANDGLVTTLGTGTVTFTATLDGKTATESITITSAELDSIQVTPALPSMAAGNKQKFVATGTYTDASKHIITEEVDWTTSSAAIATISGARGSKGTATGVAKGTVTISASFAGKTGSTSMTVTDAILTAITVTPNKPVIADGTTLELHATGTFSDNSTKDLTSDVTWTTSSAAIATVSNAAGSDGLVTGVAPGTVTITASLSGKSHGAVIRVTDAVLSSISLTPLDTSIAIGTTKQFKAIGIFTDESQQDVTKKVSWVSSEPTLASIANGGEKLGLATALKAGQTVIRASLSGKTASTTLTVTAASLASITITASPMTIAKGTTTQFIATGNYTDGSKQIITEQVTWESSATNVATISNSQNDGLATGIGTGTTTIKATLSGTSVTATLTVTSAVLSSMAITPTGTSIVDGTSKSLTATGTFSDGTKQDLTSNVSWSSTDTSIATVSNKTGEKGQVQGQKPGKATIVAALADVSAVVEVTVTAAERTKIVLAPQAPQVAKETTTQMVAKAVYTDGSEEVVTSAVLWSSSNTGVATTSNDAGSKGLVMAVAPGTSVIRISLGTLNASVTLTVTSATLSSLAITPGTAATVVKGANLGFIATGTFSDNTTQILTLQTVWTSSNTDLATISNSLGSQGRAAGVAAGSVTITAATLGKAATAPLTITAQ